MHWSAVGRHSNFIALQSSHDFALEHELHSKLDAANEWIDVTDLKRTGNILIDSFFSETYAK